MRQLPGMRRSSGYPPRATGLLKRQSTPIFRRAQPSSRSRRSIPCLAAGRYNFSVRDVDAWWEALRDRAEVVEPLFDTPYGTRKFTVRDPDGNELGFVRED